MSVTKAVLYDATLRRMSAAWALALYAIAALFTAFAALTVFAEPSLAQSTPSAYTTGFRWDSERQMVGQISAPPDPTAPTTGPYPAVRYTYSNDGQLTRIESGSLATWQSDSVAPASWAGFTVQRVTDVAYDVSSNKASETVSSGGVTYGVTQYSYDNDDRQICTATRMNLASLPVDACTLATPGPHGRDRISRNVYDAAGQVLQVRKAVGTGTVAPTGLEQAYVTYSYTPNGKQEYVVDANGNRAKLEYDAYDRQAKWIFPAQTRPAAFDPLTPATALASAGALNAADFEQYDYDAGNNRISLRKRDGITLTFQYDALSRMKVKIVPDTRAPILATTHSRDVYFDYDLRGLQTEARFDSAAGEGVSIAYDGAGRIISSTLAMNGASRTLAYQNDANGNRSRVTFPDLNFASYDYDGLNRPNTIRENGAAKLRGYAYSGFGQLLSDSSGGGGGGITSFEFDPVGRLQTLTRDLGGTFQDNTTGFGYNAASQIVQESRSNDAYAFTARYNVSRPYTANGLNQYTAAGAAGFCYDSNGNLTADGTNVYLYDAENRLVESRSKANTACPSLAVDYAGALNVNLRYDPLGRLYESIGPVTGTTRFLIDGDALVTEYDGNGTLLRRYVHGANAKADDPAMWYEGAAMWSANLRYLHANQQGSLVAATDPVGTTLRLFRYDEYGIAQAGDGAALTPDHGARFLYTGQAWLPDLGMYYYKARIYSATLGRFLQVDPIGYKDQVNLYAYVGNDPTNQMDPTGLESPCVTLNRPCLAPGADPFGDMYRFLFGDIEAAVRDPSFRNITIAVVTVVPVGRVAKVGRTVFSLGTAASSRLAQRALRSAAAEAVGALRHGGGRIIATGAEGTFRHADDFARKYGGNASDYEKVATGTLAEASNGAKVEVHFVRNKETGQVWDMKYVVQGGK